MKLWYICVAFGLAGGNLPLYPYRLSGWGGRGWGFYSPHCFFLEVKECDNVCFIIGELQGRVSFFIINRWGFLRKQNGELPGRLAFLLTVLLSRVFRKGNHQVHLFIFVVFFLVFLFVVVFFESSCAIHHNFLVYQWLR